MEENNEILQYVNKAVQKYADRTGDSFAFSDTAEDLRVVSRAGFVIVNQLQPDENLVCTRAVAGADARLVEASEILGFDIESSTWHPDEFAWRVMEFRQIQNLGGLSNITANQIPEALTRLVARTFDIRKVFGIGLKDGEKPLGYVLFFTSGGGIENREYTEVLIHAIELALSRDSVERYISARDLPEILTQFTSMKVPEIIYQLDSESNIRFINQAVSRYGYSPDELIGTSVFDIIHPGDRENARWRVNERRTGNRRTFNYELRLLTKNNRPVFFLIRGNRIEMEPVLTFEAEGLYSGKNPCKKNYQGTVGVARDVTEKKALEQGLAEQERLFKSITDNLREVTWLEQMKPRAILYVSPAFETVFGIPREKAYGDPDFWMNKLHPEDRDKICCALQGSEIAGNYFEYRIVNGNDVRWIRSRLIPCRNGWGEKADDGGANRCVGLAEDITELKKREIELTEALDKNNLLIREIYHRVKNNLLIVESIISIQASDVKDPEAKELIAGLQSRIQTVGLLHQLLYQANDVDAIHMDQYLEQLCGFFQNSSIDDPNRIRIEVSAVDEKLPTATAVSVGLIVTELLINAVKYAFPEGGSGVIRVSFDRRGGCFRLTVADNGIGFSAEDTESSGSLGLNLVQTLVQQLGGTFKTAREKAMFVMTVEFPVKEGEDET